MMLSRRLNDRRASATVAAATLAIGAFMFSSSSFAQTNPSPSPVTVLPPPLPPADVPLPFAEEFPAAPEPISQNRTPARTVDLIAQVLSGERTAARKVQLIRDLALTEFPQAAAPAIAMLGDADPLVRAEAARTIGLVRGTDAGKSLAAVRPLLKEASPAVRIEAACAATRLGDAEALAAALDDRDATVIRTSIDLAKSLLHFGDTTVTPSVPWQAGFEKNLVGKLRELDPRQQISALGYFGSRGKPADAIAGAAVESLLQTAVKSDSPTSIALQIAAVNSLGRLGGAAHEAAVAPLLTHAHASVRRAATTAIASLDLPLARHVEVARKMLGDADETVREAAARSLAISPSAAAIADLVAKLGDAYTPLHEALRDALVAAGSAQQQDAATRSAALDACVALLSDANARRREDGMNVLRRLKSDAGFPRQIELLADADWAVIDEAARNAAQLRRAESLVGVAALVGRARLPRFGNLEGIPLDPATQEHAVSALSWAMVAAGYLHDRPSLEVARPLIHDRANGERLRSAAVWLFGAVGEPSDGTCGQLRSIIGNIEEAPGIKAECYKALVQVKHPASVELVRGLIQTGETSQIQWLARVAIDHLNGTRTPFPVPINMDVAQTSVRDAS